jgi:hypothetical protein
MSVDQKTTINETPADDSQTDDDRAANLKSAVAFSLVFALMCAAALWLS